MSFGHVTALDQALLDQVGPFESGECTEHHPTSNTDILACAKKVQIDLPAGAPIGTLAANLGFGAEDRRIAPLAWANPDRHSGAPDGWGSDNYVCGFDYFVPAVRNQFRDLFGWEHGPRTKDPRCGSPMQDVAGTVQGRWYFDDSGGEERHLAFAPHWIESDRAVVSMGISIPGVSHGTFNFVPNSTGRVNLDFLRVTPGGPVMCYEFGESIYTGFPPDLVILVQLATADLVRVEALPQMECGEPTWVFSGSSVEFVR